MRQQGGSNNGFTLVEVLVAMVIFSVASLAVNSLIMKSSQLVSENRLASEAVALAQEQIEKLRDVSLTSMADFATSTVSSKGTTFSINRDVIENTPISGVNTLVVTITWTQRGVSKSYETRTIFTQVTS